MGLFDLIFKPKHNKAANPVTTTGDICSERAFSRAERALSR